MSTTATTPVLNPDVAFAAFQSAEAQLSQDKANLSSNQQAQSALLAAQANAAASAQAKVDGSNASIATDAPLAVQAAKDLIASLSQFVSDNTPVVVPVPDPTPAPTPAQS